MKICLFTIVDNYVEFIFWREFCYDSVYYVEPLLNIEIALFLIDLLVDLIEQVEKYSLAVCTAFCLYE